MISGFLGVQIQGCHFCILWVYRFGSVISVFLGVQIWGCDFRILGVQVQGCDELESRLINFIKYLTLGVIEC